MALSAVKHSLRQRPVWRAACLGVRCLVSMDARQLSTSPAPRKILSTDSVWSELIMEPKGQRRPLNSCFSSSSSAAAAAAEAPAHPGQQVSGSSSNEPEDGKHAEPSPEIGNPAVSSSSDGDKPPAASQDADGVFEYIGPFSAAVKRVKVLSVTSLAITAIGAPVIIALQADAGMTLSAKAGIAVTLCGFGAFTTGLLHWFASPYIINLKYNRATEMVQAQTYTFFSQKRIWEFHISEVEPSDSYSPVSSFKARGKTFYVDVDNFPDKALLERLTPLSEDDKVLKAVVEQMEQQKEREEAEAVSAGGDFSRNR